LLNSEKVGACSDNESAKVFFFHKEQFCGKWRYCRQVQQVQSQQDPPWVDFLIYSQPSKLLLKIESFSPEVRFCQSDKNQDFEVFIFSPIK